MGKKYLPQLRTDTVANTMARTLLLPSHLLSKKGHGGMKGRSSDQQGPWCPRHSNDYHGFSRAWEKEHQSSPVVLSLVDAED